MIAAILPLVVFGPQLTPYDPTPPAWTSQTAWAHNPSMKEERKQVDAQAAKVPWNQRADAFAPIAKAAYARFSKTDGPRDALRGLLADDAAGFPVTEALWELRPPDLSRLRMNDYELYRARFLVEGRRHEGSVARHGKAIKALLRADPKDAPVVGIAAFLNATTKGGNRVEGLRLARLYRQLEPSSPNGHYYLGWAVLCLTQVRKLTPAEIDEGQKAFRFFAGACRPDDWRRRQATRLAGLFDGYRAGKGL